MTTPADRLPPSPGERIRLAIDERPSTDYVFQFWSALGWTLLTFGLYWFYVFYQLMRRSRDHNSRTADLLAAAHDLAWQRADEQGKADALRARLEAVRAEIEPLRAMTGDSRDPILWTLAGIIANGLVWLAGAFLLDQDLIRHQRHERTAEADLTSLFLELGTALPLPSRAAKDPHNYVGRLLATVFTAGVYSLWWVADLMREGNTNYQQGYAWEDALKRSLEGVAPMAA